MSVFVSKQGTGKVEITPEGFPGLELEKPEWIEVTKGSTVDDMAAVANAHEAGTGAIGAHLEKSIVGWSFLDEKGDPVPVTPDNIRDLDMGVAVAIMETINSFIPLSLRAQSEMTTES